MATINGTADGEYVGGTSADDVISGLGGNDTLDGFGGNDLLQGGDGDDYLVGFEGDDTLDGGDGRDIAAFRLPPGTAGSLRLVENPAGGLVVQLVQADGSFEDVFAVTNLASGGATVTALGSMASLGTDTVSNVEDLHFYVDTYPAPTPSDQFVNILLAPYAQPIANGFAHVEGSVNDDIIDLPTLYPSADGSVNINVHGGLGDDIVNGSSGINYMRGQDGNDSLSGAGGDDGLSGDAGNDVLDGGTGNDGLRGGDGDDFLAGGDGDDYLDGEAGADGLDGGEGRDISVFRLAQGTVGTLRQVEAADGSVIVQLVQADGSAEDIFVVSAVSNGSAVVTGLNSQASFGSDTVTNVEDLHFFVDNGVNPAAPNQFTNVLLRPVVYGDFVQGSAGDDVIDIDDFAGTSSLGGGAGDDILRGNASNNNVIGGSGNDIMIGNAGDDYLSGEAGDDTIDGGEGSDIASFVLPSGTTGTIRVVEGTGGSLIVELVQDDGSVEALFEISDISNGSATVTGLGSREAYGTDIVANVEDLHFFVDNNGPAAPGQFANVRLTPTQYTNSLVGSVGDDVVDMDDYPGTNYANGDRGDDVISGTAGDDYMDAGSGNDVLNGEAGNDGFNGQDGDDVIDGGAGSDRADFRLPAGTTGTLALVDGPNGELIVQLIQADGTVEDVFRVTGDGDGSATVVGLGRMAGLGTDQVTNIENINFYVESGGAGQSTGIFSSRLQNGDFVRGSGLSEVIDLSLYPGATNAQGLRGNDVIIGTDADNVLGGDLGADTLTGGGGNDVLRGGLGNDNLSGGTGDDFLSEAQGFGVFGDDVYDGGSGVDRVSYFTDFTDVTVDLNAQGTAQQTGLGLDTLTGIEWITAGYGNDTLTGDAADNWFWTFGGNDVLSGNDGDDFFTVGAGDKVVDGGAGNDTLDIADLALSPVYTAAGVDISLALQGQAQATGIGAFTLTAVENLGGFYGADRLTGDAAANVLAGAQGNDTLVGSEGDDVLAGDGAFDIFDFNRIELVADPDWPDGIGDDVLDGGAGADLLIGGGGADSLSGGDDNDVLIGGAGNDALDGGTGALDKAVFYVPAGTAGTFSIVAGTGAQAGKKLVVLTDGPSSQVVAEITVAGGVATVVGVGIGAPMGTDTVTGVETILFSARPEDGVSVPADAASFDVAALTSDEPVDGQVFIGTGARETFQGGELTDMVSYRDSASGVQAQLNGDGRGSGSKGDAANDVYFSIEALEGSQYNDELKGNGADDLLIGLGGDDRIDGGHGDDILDGGDGNDYVTGNDGADSILGGAGNDRLGGENGDDAIDGGDGDDHIHGNNGADEIDGGDGDDNIHGNNGADEIGGGAGNDRIDGGNEDDRLDGGAGSDEVFGRNGSDAFVYVAADNVGASDHYDGGQRSDSLRLELTRSEWLRPEVQADVANLLTWLAGGRDDDGRTFEFTAFDLSIRSIEQIEILVDGVAVNPADEAVTLTGDALVTDEDNAATVEVLGNDLVPDLVASISFTQPANGVVTLVSSLDGTPSASFTYAPAASWQQLSVGQTGSDSFTYTVTDADGDVQTVTVHVTITGTNEGPVITGGDAAGAVVETEPVVGETAEATPVLTDAESNDVPADAQVIARQDLRVAPNANLGDASEPSISITGSIASTADDDWYAIELDAGEILTLDVDFAAGLGLDPHVFLYDASGNLLADNDDAPTGLGGGGSGLVQDSYVQYTAAQTGTYYIKVQDFSGFGQSSAGQYTLQVSVDSQGLQLVDGGEVTFSDLDLADTHALTVTPAAGDYLGSFNASIADGSTGDGAGAVKWSFAVDNAAVQYLAAGQVLTQSYDLAITDGSGETAVQTVTVTITGTNDVPIVSASGTNAIFGEDAAAPVGGVLAFSDVDLIDSHSVSFEPLEGGYAGSFSIAISDTATSDGSGELAWSFSADPGDFQGLREGQTVLQRYLVTVSDGNGGTTQQLVNVTIVGTNDAPVVSGEAAQTDEDTALMIDVLANDSDIDGGTVSIASVSGTSALGGTVSIVNGQVEYDPTGAAQLQALNSGQSVTDTFSYVVSDGQGGTTTATATVVVEGRADGGAVDDSFATGEDNRLYLDVLGNDVSANGKSIVGLNGTSATTATSALGAEILIFNGTIFYNPQNSAAIQALDSGETAQDSFTYSMMDGSGNVTQATVTMDVSGFTEGTVIKSGISGVMTFDSASPWSLPQSFTEDGMTVQSLYDPNSSPHLHFETVNGDSTVELYNHSGCCSAPYEFRYFNPDNGDTTFSLQGFDHFGGAGVWTSSKGGSVVVSATGRIDFSTDPLFQDVEWVRWDPNGYSGSDYIDNFTFTA